MTRLHAMYNLAQGGLSFGEDYLPQEIIIDFFQRKRFRFFAFAVQSVLVLIALVLPVTGYCDSGTGWVNNLFGLKGKSMNEVAVKVAELREDEDVNIWGLDFSPDGKYLAATSPNTVSMSSNKVEVQIWDWKNRRIVRTLEQVPGANTGLTTEPIRYSPDGRLLAACHGRSENVVIRIWDTKTWAVIHDVTDSNYGSCNAIGFTQDGKSLLGIFDRNPTKPGDNVVIYDTITWQPVWGLRTVPFYPKTLTTSPDGKIAAVGGGAYNNGGSLTQQIALLDLVQRAIIRTIPNTVDFDFGRIAWSPNGNYITAMGPRGWDGRANDGQGAYTSGPDTVMVFDAHSGKQIAGEQLEGIGHPSLRYTLDGRYLIEGDMDALGSGLGVRIWDGQHRELLQEIAGNLGSLAVSRDGRYFAAGSFKNISVWQLK